MALENIAQRALIAYHDLNITAKGILAIPVALILYRLLFRHESNRHKELPAWGPVEMALIVSLLQGSRKGIVYRIL